jgi:hypothetical protein
MGVITSWISFPVASILCFGSFEWLLTLGGVLECFSFIYLLGVLMTKTLVVKIFAHLL